MRWPNEGIMDGDTPMDHQATIMEDVLGLHWNDADEQPPATEAVLYEHEDALASYCEVTGDDTAYQVWGWLLVYEAESASLRDDHKALILAAIDRSIAAVAQEGWMCPADRRFHLRELRDKVEAIGSGRVVSIQTLLKQRLEEEVYEAMQAAMSGITDPSVAQRAVARFLQDLDNGDALDDWAYAAQAVINVAKALVKARGAGLKLDDAVDLARPLIGA
jgi:hypothetical protein